LILFIIIIVAFTALSFHFSVMQFIPHILLHLFILLMKGKLI